MQYSLQKIKTHVWNCYLSSNTTLRCKDTYHKHECGAGNGSRAVKGMEGETKHSRIKESNRRIVHREHVDFYTSVNVLWPEKVYKIFWTAGKIQLMLFINVGEMLTYVLACLPIHLFKLLIHSFHHLIHFHWAPTIYLVMVILRDGEYSCVWHTHRKIPRISGSGRKHITILIDIAQLSSKVYTNWYLLLGGLFSDMVLAGTLSNYLLL